MTIQQRIPCKHWTDGNRCGVLGITVSKGMCLKACKQYDGPERTKELVERFIPVRVEKPRSRGLGDTIKKFTTKLGLKPCGGCKKRAELLNKLIPYRDVG